MVAWRQCCVLLAGVVLLGACERSGSEEAAPEAEETPSTELLPVAEPPLDRERLLFAVARAASDYGAGRDDRQRQRQLDGRRFEVRLRFGCEGVDDSTRQWSFDERQRVLRVRVESELSAEGPAIDELGLEPFEAVEGFWVRRPWLLEAACPTARAATGSEARAETEASSEADDAPAEIEELAMAPRIAIAHFFTEQDSRTLRRDRRAYEATVKLAEGESPSAAGYDLILSGRLARLPDGRVIACAGDAASSPPRCVVSVDFDGVRLTRPDGTVVAEWSSG